MALAHLLRVLAKHSTTQYTATHFFRHSILTAPYCHTSGSIMHHGPSQLLVCICDDSVKHERIDKLHCEVHLL